MLITNSHNPVLPKNSNLLNVSFLKDFYHANPYRSFSVKYVAFGKEFYTVNGRRYEVSDKQYLLANSHSEGSVLVESKSVVKGICIDVSPEIITEATAGTIDPGVFNDDIKMGAFLNSPGFFENVYASGNTYVGNFIETHENKILDANGKVAQLSNEFYYHLAEMIIKDHIPVLKQLQNIKAVKPETRKMILHKLLCGKEIMDSSFLQTNYIHEIASAIGFSEYHFFRLFKSVFGVSPLKYINNKRMNYAHELLKQGNMNVTDVALLCAFPDSFSFSKAFKKHFDQTPSQVLNKKQA